MGKNVGLTYVKEFSFPAEQGFTGSAGVNQVRGYSRGGRVKKMGEGGKFGKPGDKYPTLKSGPKGKRSKMPPNVKNRGGSVHDKLKHEGGKMGYAYGGQVKDTSGEFVEKRGKQDTMDHGVQPAQTGRNTAEVAAGGNKRLKAGYQVGGAVKALETGARRVARGLKKGVHRVRNIDRTKGKGMSKRGMPKNVKAKGGLAKYAHGGYAAKPAGDKKSHPTGRGRKPYTGYNEQAGGSGNEDARYMQPRKK